MASHAQLLVSSIQNLKGPKERAGEFRVRGREKRLGEVDAIAIQVFPPFSSPSPMPRAAPSPVSFVRFVTLSRSLAVGRCMKSIKTTEESRGRERGEDGEDKNATVPCKRASDVQMRVTENASLLSSRAKAVSQPKKCRKVR